MTPPSNGNVFKRERSVAYLLGFTLNAYRPKVGLKSPKDVVGLPYIPYFIVGWRP